MSSSFAIEASAPTLRSEWRSLLRQRELFAELVRRDLRERYAGSVASGLWTVIHPLVLIVTYILVFSVLIPGGRMGERQGTYLVYLCAGLIPYSYFQEIVGRSTGCFGQYGQMLKKVSFPKSILPLTVAATALFTFGVTFTLFMAFIAAIAFFGSTPVAFSAAGFFALVGGLGLLTIFGLGAGFALGTLNVFFRDVAEFVKIALQILFWISPIVWSPENLPEAVRAKIGWFQINPLYHYVEYFHSIFVFDPDFPLGRTVLIMAAAAAAAALIGALCYRRLRDDIVDEL